MKISVIVPIRNEEQSIATLLEGLLAQTHQPEEIVICDTGSTDMSVEIAERFVRSGAPVKLIRESGAMPGRGRNVAAAHAAHDWLAFIDGGTFPAVDWLEKISARAARDQHADVVYGGWEPITDSFFKECATIAYVPPPVQTSDGAVRPISIVSALMRRTVWQSVNGFPEDLRSAEDLLFMRQIELAGYRIVREPAAIVRWNIQPTLGRTFRRFVAYARNNIRAGLWREWQAAILWRYGLIIAAALPAFFLGWRWLFVPLFVWLLLMIARATRALRRNLFSYPASPARNLARLVLLVPIIAVIDAAAMIGSIDWLVRDQLGIGKKRGNNEPRR